MKTTVDDQGSTTFHFSRRELESLLAHMSTDETRPHMAALFLDVNGGRAIATDGHRQAILQTGDRQDPSSRVPWPTGGALVPRKALTMILEGNRSSKDSFEVEPHGDDVLLRRSGTRRNVIDKLVDLNGSRIPPYDGIVPALEPRDARSLRCVAQGFCAAYLADIANIVDACPPTITEVRRKKERHYSCVELRSGTTPCDPMVAVIECPANQCRWTVVLMPVRL